MSHEGEIIDYGVSLDIVDKSGAWFSYKETKLGQGKENSKAFLKEHPEIASEIVSAIKSSMGIEHIINNAGKDTEEDND